MALSSAKKLLFLEHTAFWVFMYFFIFDYYLTDNKWIQAIGNTFLEVATYAAIVYLNLRLLIPLLLQKKKIVLYILSVLLTIVAYVLVMQQSGLEQVFYEHTGWRNIFSMVLNTSLFLLISLLYWYFKQGQLAREQHFVLQKEKLEIEINFLRAQISPHFIFNTLNNIYTLALQKHDNTAPMVAKLSTLLRYVLYDGGQGTILLKKEIDTLKQYIELHLLRKPRSQNVDFYTEGNPNGWEITPMLLINFVENAFKHSNLDQDENAWIKIHSEINDNGKLLFSTQNNAQPTMPVNEYGGIGLQNVRRQIALNYPQNYSLTVDNNEGIFTVELTLQLTKK
jgi:sensor histidine kinase YesM